MKIHAIKSLSSLDEMLEVGYGITDLVEDIIGILDQLSMNHLPREVKMFVKHCDITTHEYNQRTLIGAPDSLWGFDARHFSGMNIDNYQKSEWDNWIARQQKPEPEPEPAAATYTSLDDEEEGCDDNSISNALYRHVKSRLEKELQKAVKDWEDCNDYDSLDASEQHESGPEGSIDSVLATNPPDRLKHKSSKRKEPPLLYSDNPPLHPRDQDQQHADHHHDFDNENDDDDNDNGTSSSVKAEYSGHQQHAYHHQATLSPRFPPRFISCPNGTLFLVISHSNSQKILDTSHMDLENILLS